MSLILALWMLTTVMARMTVDDQPYCAVRYRRLCQGKGRHVACQFPSPGPGDSCQNYHHIHFSQELKHFITNYINRNGIASSPFLLSGSRTNAVLCMTTAEQQYFAVRYPYSGQTVGEVKWRRFSESDELSAQRAIRRVLDAWWGERRRVTVKQVTEPFRLTAKGNVWGHFSQLAVWTLRAVGCGAVRHGVEYAKLLLVCDFSHTNMLGQRTLTPGPLVQCPIHTIRRSKTPFPLLCSPVRFSSPSPLLSTAEDDQDYDVDDDENDDTIEDDEEDFSFTTRGPIELTTMSRSDLFKDEEATKFAVVYKSRSTMRRIGVKDENYGLLVKDISKSNTPGQMVDKLQEELGRGDRKRLWVDNDKYQNKRWPTYRKWRENQETEPNDASPNARVVWRHPSTEAAVSLYLRQKVADSIVLENIRQKTTTLLEATEVGWFYGPIRHRWKYTRDRPLRPGAEALLANKLLIKNVKLPRPPEKQSALAGSLIMDKEDTVQLFKDTGFKPNWRQHVTKS